MNPAPDKLPLPHSLSAAYEQETVTFMSPHRVPNSSLAELPDRGRLRVFFPGLYTENCAVQLDTDMLSEVYGAMVAAMRWIDYASSMRWSPTYRAAVAIALKANNRDMQWSNHPIARENANVFVSSFIIYLRQRVDWAEHMVFQVQVQGVKDLYQHARQHHAADSQLDTLLQPYDTSKGLWWIDVGLDIYMPDYVLQWRTTSHPNVIAHALRIPLETARRACHISKRGYHRDISAHLPDLSGCRVALKPREGGEVQAAYGQLYSSDKNLQAHKSRHSSAKLITGHMAIKGQPPGIFIEFYSMNQEAAASLSVSVRIELRVPLHHERSVLMEAFPEWLLNASLLIFKRRVWWYVHPWPIYHLSLTYTHFSGDGAPSGSTPSVSFCPCRMPPHLVPAFPPLPS